MAQGIINSNPSVMQPSEDVIDLRHYFGVFKRHKVSIFGLAFISTLIAALVVFAMKPVYQSTATLLIEAQDNKIVSIEEVYGMSNGKKEYFETQFGILRSRELAKTVIEKLNLAEHKEFMPDEEGSAFSFDWRALIPQGLLAKWLPKLSGPAPDEAETANNKLIDEFQSRLSVNPIRNSYLVNISFEANNRQLAAQVANTLSENYIESELDARLQMTTKATGWLTGRLEGLREKLKQSEEELQNYREQEKMLEGGGANTLTTAHIQELNQRLVMAQERNAVAAASYQQVNELKGKSWKSYLSVPAVLNDSLVATLKQSESEALRKVSSLSKRYGPKHPKMIEAKADLAEAEINVKNRVESVVAGIEKEYRVTRAEQSAVSSSLANTKGEMQQLNRKGYRLGVLEREVEANRQLYDMFLSRYKETNETAGLDAAHARVADPAVPAIKPVKPKKKLIVLIAGAVGLFIGVLLAFLMESLDNTIKTAGEMEDKLNLPVLGILSHLNLKAKSGQTPLQYARENKQSFFSESIRTIRTGILLSGLDNPHKVILVTSSVPGEGKSTVSMNLADALGEMTKVLLIDADMRRPTVAKAWGLKEGSCGLSEYVSKSAKASECIHQLGDTKVFVMPSGVIPPNPLELLSAQRFADALDALGNTFEHIVIDSAPTLAVSDALVLSRYASGVVYVLKSDATPYPMAQEGLKRLGTANAHLIGGVLNDVPEKKGRKGYGKYGYYTGNYYGSYGYSKEQA